MTTKQTKPKAVIGAYIRVSTAAKKQNADKKKDQEYRQTFKSQKHAIEQWAESAHIPASEIVWYADRITGKTMNRKALTRLLKHVDQGKVDCVCVYDLSRFARNRDEGIKTLADLARKCRVVSVSENIDFSNSTGMLIASILISVAQWSREQTVEKIRAGLAARRAEGHKLGRPRDMERLTEIRKWYDDGLPVKEICNKLNVSRQNIYAALKKTA